MLPGGFREANVYVHHMEKATMVCPKYMLYIQLCHILISTSTARCKPDPIRFQQFFHGIVMDWMPRPCHD